MSRRRHAEALLVGLDGVLRRWDPAVAALAEARYGLPAGTVLDTNATDRLAAHLDALGLTDEFDADDRIVRGARVAGLPAYRWTGPGDVPYLRAALALGVPR